MTYPFNHLSLEMVKVISSPNLLLYDYLSMLGLKLIHVSKTPPDGQEVHYLKIYSSLVWKLVSEMCPTSCPCSKHWLISLELDFWRPETFSSHPHISDIDIYITWEVVCKFMAVW